MYLYKYYILPLRIFFIQYQKKITEAEKFINYFFLVIMAHLVPILAEFLLFLDKKHLGASDNITWWGLFLFIMTTIFICYKMVVYFIRKYELTTIEVNSRRLYLIGLAIYIEPFVFPILAIPTYLYFHFHKFQSPYL